MKKVILQKGKEKSLQRFHPWVFSGAIAKKEGRPTLGEVVEVVDYQGNYLATGHFHDSSIAVRVFSFQPVIPDRNFWKSKFEKAVAFRKNIGLLDNPNTTIFRLINGEGDGLPGLIVDWFDGNVVFQFHAYGMFQLKEVFADILLELLPTKVKSIYNKSAATLIDSEVPVVDGLLHGSFDEVLVKENGIPFYVDIVRGQKTGFFIDQRENRHLVQQFAQNRNVLNLFCYTGGFSSYALMGNAALVHSVDISKKAIDFTNRNMALLPSYVAENQAFAENVFDFLDNMDDHFYDLIILDPPAFAKHHQSKEQGIKGYRNINRKAMAKLKPGSFLFTFSCSQAISKDDFQTIVFSAAAMENKQIRVVKQLQHGIDHPVNIFHPEGNYLKGLLLYID